MFASQVGKAFSSLRAAFFGLSLVGHTLLRSVVHEDSSPERENYASLSQEWGDGSVVGQAGTFRASYHASPALPQTQEAATSISVMGKNKTKNSLLGARD